MEMEEIYKYISSDTAVLHGKPCIKGTRIPVYLIVSLVGEGLSVEEIIKDYPSLKAIDIKAAVMYSAKLCEYEAYAI